MAGFIFFPKSKNLTRESLSSTIRKQFLEIENEHQVTNGTLITFKSQWEKYNHNRAHYSHDNNHIYFFGHGLYHNQPISSQLPNLLRDYLSNDLKQSQLIGQYAFVIATAQKTEILVDTSNFYKVYSDGNILSTSFLLLAKLQSKLTWNTKTCHLFDTFGYFNPLESFFNEIKCLGSQGVTPIRVSQYTDYKLALDEHAHELIQIYKGVCQSEKSLLGLTGGLDSRLVLAVLSAAKIKCSAFTKGLPSDLDLKIAKQIAQELKLDFINPTPTLALAEKDSFYYWDGPNHWGHVNAPEDLGMEHWRAEQSCELLSGLGIGLYRDIWFHKNSGMSLSQLLSQRYHSTDLEQVMKLATDSEDYLQLSPDQTLARDDFDKFHFYYRCASLWGRRSSVQGRHSNKYIPMLGQKMHTLSCSIPQQWKYNAKFQRDLICHLEPRLATIATSYNDFPLAPNKLASAKEAIRRHIPIALKRSLLQKSKRPKSTNNLFSDQHKRSAILLLANEFSMESPW